MRIKKLIIVLFLFFLAQIAAVSHATNQADNFSRTLKPNIPNSPDDFSFVIMSDRTARERAKIFEEAVDKINLVSPSFVINVGDFIEGYTDPDKTKKEWEEAIDILSRLKMPFFLTPGNHDIANTGALKEWNNRFGPTYYNFIYKNVLFIVLNSEGYSSLFGHDNVIDGYEILDKQNSWLKAVLNKNKDVRWTFIFLHNPVWDYNDEIPPKWLEVEKMLNDRPYTVFAGHWHAYTKETRHNRDYISLATTGGMNELKGIDYGQFDHITYVTMRNDTPVIANLMLPGILDKNVREKEWRDLLNCFILNVSIEPDFDRGNTFSKGFTRFRIKNPSDRTVPVKAEVFPRGSVSTAIKPDKGEIPSGKELNIDLEMKAEKPIFYGEIKPITLVLTYYLEKPTGGIFDLKQKITVYPQTRYYCPTPPQNIAIDGDLDEWGELPFSSVIGLPDEEKDTAEPPLRFAVAADSKYLYIAGNILDDEPFFSIEKYNYEQDGMVISLDARNDPERSKNRDGGDIVSSVENQVFTLVGPVKSKVGHAIIGDLPENSIVKGKETDNGYLVEVAIPMKYLNTMQGGICRAFRLNIGISDVDPSKGAGSKQSMWRPDRFFDNALPGAGTFILNETISD